MTRFRRQTGRGAFGPAAPVTGAFGPLPGTGPEARRARELFHAAFAGQPAVLLACLPILDVQVEQVIPRRQPAFPRIVAAEDEVGRVICRTEAWAFQLLADRVEQIAHALR